MLGGHNLKLKPRIKGIWDHLEHPNDMMLGNTSSQIIFFKTIYIIGFGAKPFLAILKSTSRNVSVSQKYQK